jgi:hypothetical protein
MSDDKPATTPITRTSMISGVTRTLYLSVTQEQLDRYEDGVLLQDAFPDLPREDREFIKSGITAEEWEREFASAEWPASNEPEFRDNELYLVPVTSDTLALVMDMLWARDVPDSDAQGLDAEPPDPAHDRDIDLEIG